MTAVRLEQPIGLRLKGRPSADVELVLRVKNEEGRVARLLWQAASHLQAQAISGTVVIVDCGSVDHTIEVALMTSGEVPVQVVSCSEAGYGWMAAATATSTAATIAFASGVDRIDLVGQTRALMSPRSVVVATTTPSSARRSRQPRAPRILRRRTLPAAPTRIHLMHMATATAAELLSDSPAAETLDDLIFQCLANSYEVHELRIYEPGAARPVGDRWSWPSLRPNRRARISLR